MSKHIDYEINKELGECYLFMGEFDKAREYYSKAVACDVGYADPYLGLATIEMQAGQAEAAKQHYVAALGLEASDKAYAGLGLSLAELGREPEAFDNFIDSLKLNPINMIAMRAMLHLAYRLGRIEEALPRLESALNLTEDESLRFTLAGCLSYLGRDGEAREQLEILLGHNPGNAGAQELYARLVA